MYILREHVYDMNTRIVIIKTLKKTHVSATYHQVTFIFRTRPSVILVHIFYDTASICKILQHNQTGTT